LAFENRKRGKSFSQHQSEKKKKRKKTELIPKVRRMEKSISLPSRERKLDRQLFAIGNPIPVLSGS
jgi:hypothetical protein